MSRHARCGGQLPGQEQPGRQASVSSWMTSCPVTATQGFVPGSRQEPPNGVRETDGSTWQRIGPQHAPGLAATHKECGWKRDIQEQRRLPRPCPNPRIGRSDGSVGDAAQNSHGVSTAATSTPTSSMAHSHGGGGRRWRRTGRVHGKPAKRTGKGTGTMNRQQQACDRG